MSARSTTTVLMFCGVATLGCRQLDGSLHDGLGYQSGSGLHTPWAVGSELTLQLETNKSLPDDMEAISSDAGVLEVIGAKTVEGGMEIAAVAVAPGSAEIAIRG